MESLLLGWILAFATVATVAINTLLGQYWPNIRFRTSCDSNSDCRVSSCWSAEEHAEDMHGKLEAHSEDNDACDIEELKALKQLYYQLHNLEKFPEVLPQAKRVLLCLLKETCAAAEALPDHESILSVQSF
jgi:hypothetical protein